MLDYNLFDDKKDIFNNLIHYGMKKIFVRTFVLLTIGLFLFISCEKEPEPEKDYRLKWVGTYECEKTSNLSNFDACTVCLDVTIADEDSLINIYEQRDSIESGSAFMYINYKATVNAYGDTKYYSGHYNGKGFLRATFYGDSIYVFNSVSVALGSGSSAGFVYKGLKK